MHVYFDHSSVKVKRMSAICVSNYKHRQTCLRIHTNGRHACDDACLWAQEEELKFLSVSPRC